VKTLVLGLISTNPFLFDLQGYFSAVTALNQYMYSLLLGFYIERWRRWSTYICEIFIPILCPTL